MRKFSIIILSIVTLVAVALTTFACSNANVTDYEGDYIAGENGSIGALSLNDDGTFTLKYTKNKESKTVTGIYMVKGSKLTITPNGATKFVGAISDGKVDLTFDGITFLFVKKVATGGEDNGNNEDPGGGGDIDIKGYNCEYFYTATFSMSDEILKAIGFSKDLSSFAGNVPSDAKYGYNLKTKITFKPTFTGKFYKDAEKTVEITDGILPVFFGENTFYLTVDTAETPSLAEYKFNFYLTKEYILNFYDIDVLTGTNTLFHKMTVYEDRTPIEFTEPKQKNVTFVKWVTQEGADFSMTSKINANADLYSSYDKVVLTFKWQEQGIKQVYVVKGELCQRSAVPTPVLDGYTLTGWENEQGADWNIETPCVSNVTITAQWTVKIPSDVFTFQYNQQTKSYILSGFTGVGSYVKIPSTHREGDGEVAPITGIAEEVFLNKSNIISIEIPDTVTTIGARAFEGCGLTSIKLPSGMTTISSSLFSGCSKLIEIDIPTKVKNISTSAFSRCSSLITINLPKALTGIGASAFFGCSSLKSIVMPEGVKNIYQSTFDGCFMMKSVTLSQTTESIAKEAFLGCANLKEIVIPSTVKYIGGDVFKGCSSLVIKLFFNDIPTEWDKNWNSSHRDIIYLVDSLN